MLFASKLAVEYWPFAVRYAVEQNLREQLLEMGGTTLPPQIPFGSEVQAKLRSWKRPEGLGRKAVWSAETVRAVALGTPPDTVNGQVVSLPDGPLVVAATVFPMPVVPPIKPVYRLTDKTAPDEVVTELRSKPHHSADKPAEDDPEEFRPAEAPVSHRMRGKSSPASVSWIRAFCPGTEWGESDVDFYFDADSLSAVPREEISEGIGRECWDESLVELPGRNEGLRDFEENDGSEEEEHEDGSKDSRLSKLEGEGRGRIESAAKEVLEGGWSVEKAREVIAMAAQFLQGYARTGAVGEGEEAGYQSFGLFSHGGVVGVTKHTAMFPSLTKLLTSWVQHHFPDDGFSTVTISSGIRMKRHLDKFNLGGTSNLVTLISGDYDRDGVWIQGAGPDEQSAPVWLDGHQGHVRPIGRQGCKLNPRVYHATAPDACVDGRCLVVGYTKSAIRKATHAQLDELVGVGFPVDRILGRQEKAQLEVEVELPNLEASEVLAESDPNLWSVCKGSQVWAWVLCYVDDLLVVGPSVVVERVKQGLSGLWKMGTWDSPSDGKAVKYCGMQLFRDPDGTIRIGQQSFVEDLLKRHEVPSDLKAATPLASWEDPLPEENVQLSDVRRAQGIAGEVQWLVSRSRPDLLYAASKLSIWSTRAPTAVWKAAQGVLKYLNATKEMYLVYPPTVPPLGENAHLPFARTPDILEIQVDASHAPQGGRSHQTAIIMHMGCAVAWEAARQTITALSSAESELIAAISGMQLGESMLSLVAELTGLSISPIELTDNATAVSVLTGEQTAWKGRHLRMRGAALRERVHSNSWRVLHIPGEMNGADIGTKPLGGARLKRLAELIGLRLGGEVEASLSSLNAVADAPKRERTTCISSGTHGAGTTLRKLLLLLLVVQTARAEGDTESSSESQSWETLFLIVMCIFVWEAVKLTGRRIHNRVRVRRLGLVAQPREGTRFSGASSLEEGQALSVSAARVTRLGGALSLEESQALSESAAQVTRSGGASSSEQGQAFSLGDEVQGLNAVVSGLVSEEPPGSPWSTASQVAEAHRRYPQLTRKLESFVWLTRSRGWVLQDAGVHEGSAFVIVGLLGAQQARDISRVELLNQHAGELGWTISDVDFDARGCFVLYEYPPVEPSTPTSESSDVGVVEVGSRAGGSDAHDAQGGFQGGAGAVWDHEIQEYDVADAYWTVGPVEGTPGVEGDAQDAQLALDAGQSEVVANPWGEGGNGWASSTVDAPSEEERGHRASPDTLADELLRQGFFRLQEFPGDHFYWLVFPSPGIELPFYAEDPAVGYVIPRLPYERAWMRPLGQPQTEDYWSIDVGRRRITRWHLRRRTLLFDPNHENLALPNITLSDRRLTRLVVRYAEDQSNVGVLQDFRSEGRLSPLGTARWVGSTTFSVL